MEIQGVGAVVTGGASGLGEATARALAARGAQVAILDLGRSKGAEVADALGDGAFFAEADVADEAAVGAALERAAQRFGGLHVCVNCAGIGSAMRTVDKDGKPFDLRVFRKTIEVNLIGTFNVLRLAASHMTKNAPNQGGERGVVVNTASAAAFDGQIGQAAYSASKAGVVGMTLPIARDLAKLGIFETPLLMTMPEPARQALAATIPFPSRLGRPPEFASLAVEIIGNAMLNGETIRLDGAVRMPPR
jgi:3-hydroxyacyl-CoA dehydrogenase / 3-hydroxy-2-methylbutyryl-CoA dehydrogenase